MALYIKMQQIEVKPLHNTVNFIYTTDLKAKKNQLILQKPTSKSNIYFEYIFLNKQGKLFVILNKFTIFAIHFINTQVLI